MLAGFRNIPQNLFNPAVHNPAEVIQGCRADRLVVPEPVDGRAADAVLVNQNVGAQVFFFQCGPERFVRNHRNS